MTRNTVTIVGGQLVVEPHGLEKLWSFTRAIRVPLAHVRGATHDPGMGREPKGWRGPGLRAGSKLVGTFHEGRERQFWNVAGYQDVVVIELAPEAEHFNRLIVSVDQPNEVVDQINAAVASFPTP